MNIAENLNKLRKEIPENVKLVAVSKFHPSSMILEAYHAGQKIFGESRVQEFIVKKKELPEDIEWHFIGHLQTNKVKHIIGETHLIESVDSEKLLEIIDKESEKAGLITQILMQVHIAREETKFGFSAEEINNYFKNRNFEHLKSVHIRGIMGMASNTDDKELIISDFKKIADIYNNIRNNRTLNLRDFDILSMGMSGDWKEAITEGSNNIRIGSSIFGSR